MEYPPFPGLVAHSTGNAIAQNLAFQHWLDLLLKDAVLNQGHIRQIERVYLQSGLASVKWETIPGYARQIMTQLMICQYSDWFDMAGWSYFIDGGECWEKLRLAVLKPLMKKKCGASTRKDK